MRLVAQTIMVQSKSRAESTVEAMRESEDEKKHATILAIKRKTFATTLIWIVVVSEVKSKGVLGQDAH